MENEAALLAGEAVELIEANRTKQINEGKDFGTLYSSGNYIIDRVKPPTLEPDPNRWRLFKESGEFLHEGTKTTPFSRHIEITNQIGPENANNPCYKGYLLKSIVEFKERTIQVDTCLYGWGKAALESPIGKATCDYGIDNDREVIVLGCKVGGNDPQECTELSKCEENRPEPPSPEETFCDYGLDDQGDPIVLACKKSANSFKPCARPDECLSDIPSLPPEAVCDYDLNQDPIACKIGGNSNKSCTKLNDCYTKCPQNSQCQDPNDPELANKLGCSIGTIPQIIVENPPEDICSDSTRACMSCLDYRTDCNLCVPDQNATNEYKVECVKCSELDGCDPQKVCKLPEQWNPNINYPLGPGGLAFSMCPSGPGPEGDLECEAWMTPQELPENIAISNSKDSLKIARQFSESNPEIAGLSSSPSQPPGQRFGALVNTAALCSPPSYYMSESEINRRGGSIWGSQEYPACGLILGASYWENRIEGRYDNIFHPNSGNECNYAPRWLLDDCPICCVWYDTTLNDGVPRGFFMNPISNFPIWCNKDCLEPPPGCTRNTCFRGIYDILNMSNPGGGEGNIYCKAWFCADCDRCGYLSGRNRIWARNVGSLSQVFCMHPQTLPLMIRWTTMRHSDHCNPIIDFEKGRSTLPSEPPKCNCETIEGQDVPRDPNEPPEIPI